MSCAWLVAPIVRAPFSAAIKAQLRNTSLAKLQTYAKKALACRTPEEVRALPSGLTNMRPQVVTITLNPAIDRTVKIANFTAGAVNRVESVQSHPGGKGIDVASALADQGYRVAVTGFLGRSNAGAFEELFAGKKIADEFVRIAGQTRIGIKISDPARSETTDINFPGPKPSPNDITMFQEKVAKLEAGWFVIAGNIPPGVPATIYYDLVKSLRARGIQFVLDASGESFPLALAAAPNVIKPNISRIRRICRP